jgi:hypothetical protein
MNVRERAEFLDAMRKTVRLIKLTQTTLQRARAQCHGEVYEQINLMTKQVYEMRTKSEWLRYIALTRGELTVRQGDPEARQGADRRVGIDRRIQAMRQQLLPVAVLETEA